MIYSGNKKRLQESIKDEDNPGSSKKCFRTMWQLEPMAAGGVNTDNLAEFPHFVLNAVKVYLSKNLFFYIAII